MARHISRLLPSMGVFPIPVVVFWRFLFLPAAIFAEVRTMDEIAGSVQRVGTAILEHGLLVLYNRWHGQVKVNFVKSTTLLHNLRVCVFCDSIIIDPAVLVMCYCRFEPTPDFNGNLALLGNAAVLCGCWFYRQTPTCASRFKTSSHTA